MLMNHPQAASKIDLLNFVRASPLILVESRGDIIPRPSQLDPDVLVSPHPAPDVLGLRLCSCGDNRGSFRELLEGYLFSNYYGNHLHDADVPFHRLAFLSHIFHIYGFAVLKL
jgi:hypothetical protein